MYKMSLDVKSCCLKISITPTAEKSSLSLSKMIAAGAKGRAKSELAGANLAALPLKAKSVEKYSISRRGGVSSKKHKIHLRWAMDGTNWALLEMFNLPTK